jgi:uncharacterized OB-fold protein
MQSDEVLFAHFGQVGLDHDNKELYRGFLDRQLRLNRCAHCARWQNPPLPMCPACWSTEMVATAVSGRGSVHLLTFMHQGPPTPGVDYSTPYAVGAVELEEQVGLRFTSSIVGADGQAPTIGAPVELDWIDRDGAPFPIFTLCPS